MKSRATHRLFAHTSTASLCEIVRRRIVFNITVFVAVFFCASTSWAALPSPWVSQDIGGPAIIGSASELEGKFTLTAGGNDIWSTADEFHFMYQPVVGDCEVIVQVQSVFESNEWAKAGLMIRETLDDHSKNALMAVRAGNGLTFQRRATTGESTISTKVGVDPSVDDYDAPYWLRLVRSGDDFSAYYSPDGGATGWTQLGATATIVMNSVVYIGLELCSKNTGVGTTSVFSDVSLTATPLSSTQIRVNSLSQLKAYVGSDNVNVVMTPGIYRIGPEDVDSGLFTENTLLNFSGSGSTYDFTGVTIEFDTRLFRKFGSVEVIELAVWGEDLVLKNLTMTDIGTTRPQKTALGVLLEGSRNRVEGFTQTIRGSYPYGYGDIFGKGGPYVIKHYKHSAVLIRGDDNHLKDCKIYHRAYGHGIFCQASVNAKIEGCYVEGEVRTTDEVLAELGTGSHADLVDFLTIWGWDLIAGSTFSLQEDGIRAYNTGSGPGGIERNTKNIEVIDCTVKNMRSGVTIGFCDDIKYVENCVVIGTEDAYWTGTEGEVLESAGDAQFGYLYTAAYQNDRDSVVDLTVLEPEGPYTNNVIAYLAGSGHDITLKSSAVEVASDLKVMVAGFKEGHRWVDVNPQYNDLSASNITLNNLTKIPVVMAADSSSTSGQSGGPVTDSGSNNNLSSISLDSCGGFAVLQTIQAEDYCGHRGVSIEASGDGGFNVGSIHHGDWVRFDDVFFGSGPARFEARVIGSSIGGDIEIRLNGVAGELIGTCKVDNSTGAQTWGTKVTSVVRRRGKHDVYLVFTGDSGLLMNIDSFKFSTWQNDPVNRVESDMVGHWTFDDGTGAIAEDSSGLSNDGVVTDATWVPGIAGDALDFSGSTSQVEIPASVFADIENEITISMWVYGDSGQPLGDSVFYAENAASERVLNIHIPYSNSTVYWDAGNDAGYDTIERAVTADQYEGQWNHWTFVKNVTERTMKVYHNGVLYIAGIEKTKVLSGITEATIGIAAGTFSYAGAIDDVRIYKVALTESEVEGLYDSYTFNAPPRATPASLRARLNTSTAITLTGTDEEGSPLTYFVEDTPIFGVLSGAAPSLLYTPLSSFTGVDSFTFKVNDGESDSALATVVITLWEGQLVAHWALDDASGTVVSDSSGNGHHATLEAGTWGSGFDGGALEFDGVDDSVTLPASAFISLVDQLTISMWVYGNLNLPLNTTVFYAADSVGDRLLNVHLPWGNSSVYWDAGNNSGYDRIQKPAVADEYKGQWNHWVFSKNATSGEMKIFLNGVRWHSGNGMIRELSGITAASLGSQFSSNSFDGLLDDVMLFDYAMSDAEIVALYADYSVADSYVTWLTGFPSLIDTSISGDPELDGMATVLEFVFDGDPSYLDSKTILLGERIGGNIIFTFTRRVDSATSTTQVFQYASTLDGNWTDLNITDPTAAGVSLGTASGGLQAVTITISQDDVVGGKLFGRLAVSY